MTRILQNKNNSCITEGSIYKGLLSFFFPILFGTFFQQLYNTVDAVIVGRFVGKEALAAVGGGTSVYVTLLVGFFVGLSSGAGVIISQFYGAKDDKVTEKAVHTAISLSIICSVIITVVGIFSSKFILSIMNTPQEIMDMSLVYLQIYFGGILPMIVYNMVSGIMRAVGDSRTPFIVLVISCVLNIFLDLLFVVLFKQGVRGVAYATVISQAISMVLLLLSLYRSNENYKFRFSKLTIEPHILHKMIKIGLPSGLQSVMYTISNLIIQTKINDFGTDTIAACAAWGKIDTIFWMTVSAYGVAITTFSGQNYGAKKYDRMKEGMWKCLLLASITTIVLTFVFLLSGRTFYSFFTKDENVVKIGMQILRYICPTFIFYVSIEILSGVIRGAGIATVPTIMTLVGICLLRIIWLFIVVPFKSNIITVFLSYPLTWFITSVMFWIYYLRGKWLKKIDS